MGQGYLSEARQAGPGIALWQRQLVKVHSFPVPSFFPSPLMSDMNSAFITLRSSARMAAFSTGIRLAKSCTQYSPNSSLVISLPSVLPCDTF
jgi:hypothetical protein